MSRAWMPLYVADYLADTAHLSARQSGAYLHMIMHYWQHGKLPSTDDALARITRLTPVEWNEDKATISEFFQKGWRLRRLDVELSKAEAIKAQKSAAGRTSVQKRRQRNANGNSTSVPTDVITDVMTDVILPLQRQSNQSQSPIERDRAAQQIQNSEPREIDSASDGTALPAILPANPPRKAELDELERRCREAAGLENDPSPSLLNLAPIVELLRKHYDLETDILPHLRAAKARGKRPKTWSYFIAGIVDAKQTNSTIAPNGKGAPATISTTWINTDDPRWPAIRDRWRAEKGRNPPTKGGMGGMGWSVPTAWLAELGRQLNRPQIAAGVG